MTTNPIPATPSLMRLIRQIVTAAGQLDAFEHDDHFHLKIENDPYMPLVIEAWDAAPVYMGETRHVSIAHYYEQNGDLIADPDILLTDAGVPITFEGGYFQAILFMRDGKAMINRAAARDTVSFAAQWARNIRAQGFVEAVKALTRLQKTAIDAIL